MSSVLTIIRQRDNEVDSNRAPAKSQLSLHLDRYQGVRDIAYSVATQSCVRRIGPVPQAFKIGDHVTWNSEAGYVSGTIIAIHTRDVSWKGYVHHASGDEPQYEIKSDKTDHVALHKGSALALYKG